MKSMNNNHGTQEASTEAVVVAEATRLLELLRGIELLGLTCDAAVEIGDAARLLEVLEERRIGIERIGRAVQELRSWIADPSAYSAPTQGLLNDIDTLMDTLVAADVVRVSRLEAARDAVGKELGQVRGGGRAVGAYSPQGVTTAMIEDRRA